METQLDYMETLGIGFAFLELSSLGLYTAQKEKTLRYVRRINEEAAEFVSKHPHRLGFLATLPLPYIEDSIQETVYTLDTLHADGIGVLTNSGGVYQGDRRYDDLMKELDGRGALVVIHPTMPAVSVPYVVVHSGSRHIGNEVAKYYQEEGFRALCGNARFQLDEAIARMKAEGNTKKIHKTIKQLKQQRKMATPMPKDLAYVEGQLFEEYIHDMKLIQRFAVLNRQAMMEVLLTGMGLTAAERFTTIHNYIDTEAMVLRKGAVSAKLGEKLLIPINMRDGSLICIGKGNEDWNCSAPQGAGRLMSRKDAFDRLSMEEYKQEMSGIFSTCVVADTLDESPMAYKPMDEIVAQITPTAEIVDRIKLRPVWYDGGRRDASPYDYRSASALMLGDTPLVQIQSDGCPTCASLLAAGYGLPDDSHAVQQMRQGMTRPYVGLSNALERLQPLLALLQSGVYVLTQSSLCPTDGEGYFFWNVSGAAAPYQATAEYYDTQCYRTLPSFPCFLYPTQGTQKYDASRVEYYRSMILAGQPLPPVLTYSLEASMCLLLDGHHKACACALEGVQVPALTITRPGRIWRERVPYILYPDGSEIALKEICFPGLEKLLDAPMGERMHKQYPFSEDTACFRREWEHDYAKMAARYPTCYDAGVLGLYPDVALIAEGIRKLAMDDDYEEVTAAAHLLRYAGRQPGADKKGLAMEFTQVGYPAELRRAAFEVLDGVKDDPKIDDLMVAILVNCERKDDHIYQIANGHWDAEG